MRFKIIREVIISGVTNKIIDVYDEYGCLVVGGVMTSNPVKTVEELKRSMEQEAEDGDSRNG